jgi:hypothetical protein
MTSKGGLVGAIIGAIIILVFSIGYIGTIIENQAFFGPKRINSCNEQGLCYETYVNPYQLYIFIIIFMFFGFFIGKFLGKKLFH